MFENPDFQVDEESEEFRLLNPLVSKISEKRKKKLRLLEQQELHEKVTCSLPCCVCWCFVNNAVFCVTWKSLSDTWGVICLTFGRRRRSYWTKGIFPDVSAATYSRRREWVTRKEQVGVWWGKGAAAYYFYFQEEEEEPEGKPSDAESSESSDDEKDWVEEVRKQRRLLLQEEKVKRRERLREDQQTVLQPQFYEIKAGEEFRSFKDAATKQKLMKWVTWHSVVPRPCQGPAFPAALGMMIFLSELMWGKRHRAWEERHWSLLPWLWTAFWLSNPGHSLPGPGPSGCWPLWSWPLRVLASILRTLVHHTSHLLSLFLFFSPLFPQPTNNLFYSLPHSSVVFCIVVIKR